MTLGEARAHVGDGAVYNPGPARRREQGVITSVNGYWVFVRYGSDTTSKATDPAMLELLAKGPS